MKVTSADISIAHRLRQRSSSTKPPYVIVRFMNMKARDAIYRARHSLKSFNPLIYINEDLTKTTADFYRQARLLVKDKVLYAAWTADGALYIRKSVEASCKLLRFLLMCCSSSCIDRFYTHRYNIRLKYQMATWQYKDL